MSALVLALSGTDHHPFDRLVRWIDGAAALHSDTRFVVQYGASAPPSVADGHEFLTHDHLTSLMGEADLVVCHGGPGTIMDAREAGHLPLCVPRDPRLGEHVDDHQQRFVSAIGAEGVVRAISTLEDLHRELASSLVPGPRDRVAAGVATARDNARSLLAVELEQLVLVRPRRLPRVSVQPPRALTSRRIGAREGR